MKHLLPLHGAQPGPQTCHHWGAKSAWHLSSSKSFEGIFPRENSIAQRREGDNAETWRRRQDEGESGGLGGVYLGPQVDKSQTSPSRPGPSIIDCTEVAPCSGPLSRVDGRRTEPEQARLRSTQRCPSRNKHTCSPGSQRRAPGRGQKGSSTHRLDLN